MQDANYFLDITTMPLFNWRKCQEHNSYEFCRIPPKNLSGWDARSWFDWVVRRFYKKPKPFEYTEETDAKAWATIYDSFLKEFGLGDDYERVIELTRKIAIYECDLVIEDDNFLINKVNILKAELKKLLDKPNGIDMDTCIDYIEKWRKMPLNEHETSVQKFYKLLRDYKAAMIKQAKTK